MPDFIDMQSMGQTIVTLLVAYGAIRADLKRVVNDAKEAHQRIDKHIEDHLKGFFK